MAQKKITITLTGTEAAHLAQAARIKTEEERATLGRSNVALDRVIKKLDKGMAPADSADESADEPASTEEAGDATED